ncbi:hypothetical protein AAF712_012004 [Marasmius tenuissimus]|uniref:Uncharacterized protein n=1 Tax=Marasmius tenuissimus TaxID=585030 RepID=A0ABR2ZJP2_9AGAR
MPQSAMLAAVPKSQPANTDDLTPSPVVRKRTATIKSPAAKAGSRRTVSLPSTKSRPRTAGVSGRRAVSLPTNKSRSRTAETSSQRTVILPTGRSQSRVPKAASRRTITQPRVTSQSRTASSGSSSPAPDLTTGFIGSDDEANAGDNGDGEEDVEPGEDNDKDIKLKDSEDEGVEDEDEDEDEDGEAPGRLGDTKYSFSKAQKRILMSKYPHYAAAEGGRAQVARELYDELIKMKVFAQPGGRTAQRWKKSLTRWFENRRTKLRIAAALKEQQPSAAQVPSPTGKTSPAKEIRLRALVAFFNKLVNGLLTERTGRDAYADAHPELLEHAMLEDEDIDEEGALSKLWDGLDAKDRDHWDEVASQSVPTLE